jgi:SAM-dependent methyltransferase
MNDDPWLQPWLPLIARHAGTGPVLELGCGAGLDTQVLAQAAHRVVGVDLSAAAIEQARVRVPSCEFHCQDLRAAFPAAAARVGVVVASLSLHYFPWRETVDLAARVREALVPGGLLLCRLNSTNDHHYGASGHPAIGDNYYLVHGEPKRFFDRAAVQALFVDGWTMTSLAEHVVHRYARPKALWEAVLARVG